MIEVLQHILAFIFAIGILVTFHEFGHYYIARLCDVKILRFSIGFGKPLYKKIIGEDKTEFVIASIPLGGYVKMLDEREGAVAENELDRAFNRKPLGQRFAIVFAGPLFNYIFAVAAFWLVFMYGVNGYKPIVGDVEPHSIAEKAGLESGMQILEVDGVETKIWTSAMERTVNEIIESNTLALLVRDRSGVEQTLLLNTSSISVDDFANTSPMKLLGISPERIRVPAKLAEVIPGRPAEKAGFLPGDLILSVDGNDIDYWDEWAEYLIAHPRKNINVVVSRNGVEKTLSVQSKVHADDGDNIPRVGVKADYPKALLNNPDKQATETYNPLESFTKAIVKVWDLTAMSLRVFGKMLSGEASVKNLSGPISIAQVAGYTAAAGIASYISFLGFVSVSLGLINLFPIPLLDGGHLLYYLIELVKGGPVSESVQLFGQQLGLALLLGLMSLVFYNDIMRLVG